MALTEVCVNCGAVIGARGFWSFIDRDTREYRARCPLCGQENPWRKATAEEVERFRRRATGRGSWRPSLFTVIVVLLLVLFLAPTCS